MSTAVAPSVINFGCLIHLHGQYRSTTSSSPFTQPTEHPANWAFGGPGEGWKQRGRRAGGRGARSGGSWAVNEGGKEVLTAVLAVRGHDWLSCIHGATGTLPPRQRTRHSTDPMCHWGTVVPWDCSAQDLVKVVPPADAGARTRSTQVCTGPSPQPNRSSACLNSSHGKGTGKDLRLRMCEQPGLSRFSLAARLLGLLLQCSPDTEAGNWAVDRVGWLPCTPVTLLDWQRWVSVASTTTYFLHPIPKSGLLARRLSRPQAQRCPRRSQLRGEIHCSICLCLRAERRQMDSSLSSLHGSLQHWEGSFRRCSCS